MTDRFGLPHLQEKLMGYKETYEAWLCDPYFDEDTKNELKSIADNENEIKERFYMDLEFGTAGLRGIIGAGTNRMNIYTVRKATQGLANYIIKNGGQEKGVAIAFDSRRMSPEFATESALTLAANGIKVYKFDTLRPTPELSFAVRNLGCMAGINVTASHNPAEYNGYKVYWEDGAQITPPHDSGIMAEVKAVKEWAKVKTMDENEARDKGLLITIGQDIDDRYDAEIKKLVLHQDAIDKEGDSISIVYSPLHGTGNLPVRRILKELGFTNVFVVPEQEKPDGNFPTVPYPNPETEKAFELGLKYGRERKADLILATDPDADRLGVRVRDKDGEYHDLTGNMSGSLIAYYEISQKKAVWGELPKDGCIVRSIVTTNLTGNIARDFDIEEREVLTGFKYIGQQILEMEETKKGTYLFGFEESYGCLIGTYARDKDAVSASMALCEAAAFYKTRGKTLWDVMLEIYEKYGYYKEGVQSIEMKGIEGREKIEALMKKFRTLKIESFGKHKVKAIRDYKSGEILDAGSGKTEPTGLPKSDVLYYDLENDEWVCVRPSGTEPKIKLYYGVRGTSVNDAKALEEDLKEALLEITKD